MNIVLLEPLHISADALSSLMRPLQQQGHTITVYDHKAAAGQELSARLQGQHIALIANAPFPREAVMAAKDLRLVDVAFTGVDHVALDACRERGITVCNCANYSNQSVAEMAVGLALSLLRKIPAGNDAIRRGAGSAGLMGGEIGGKTVGVIGTGRIGEQAVRLFQAFGARVIAYSRTEKPAIAALGVSYLPLDQVMEQSDIITLHVPATAETRGLIGREQISRMKNTALLINCARGPVVDAAALKDALNADRIAGAALDVFDQEPPLPADHPLFGAKNLVMTPHTAYFTQEAMERRARIAFDNIAAYLSGNPQNQIP
ncbi:MAG: hydroxyacid dehydrogenase [Clostridiales bacterium]|nr:hydroxyacid dehydrogenase [Clostridiales bacterium]